VDFALVGERGVPSQPGHGLVERHTCGAGVAGTAG
jgi:hypothetical protein